MALCYKVVPVTNFAQNCSIVWCDQTNLAAVVDPGGDIDHLLEEIDALGLTLSAIWLTHGHIDHVGGVGELKERKDIPILGPQKKDLFWLESLADQGKNFGFRGDCQMFTPDTWLEEGGSLKLANEVLQVKHIPGHTPGHVVFYHEPSSLLIAGDVLFRNSVGRSDFPMGNHDDLIMNIKQKLLILPDETTVITGHGPLTTIGAERKSNPFLKNL